MVDINDSQYRASIIERLKEAGVTPTQQRIDIARILFKQPQHLSAEDVMDLVNTEAASVSKATVYNTLGLFAKCGLVREVIVDPTKVFYDSNITEHHHFFNMDTGTLTDIHSAAVSIDCMPNLPEGTVADGIDVIIRVRQSD